MDIPKSNWKLITPIWEKERDRDEILEDFYELTEVPALDVCFLVQLLGIWPLCFIDKPVTAKCKPC